MPELAPKFAVLLKTLEDHQVDYILVGGVCAVLHGAPINTTDVDIVHSRVPENLERLEAALHELHAYYREHPPHRIVPEAKRMGTPGHHLLTTSAGPIDVLGTVSGARDYRALLPHTVEVELRDGLRIRMLDLPTLIQVKEEAGRDKDKWAVLILRQTLAEIERMQREENEGQDSAQ